MKNIVLILFFVMTTIGLAQEQLNNYKYIIVPKQFVAFKQSNQYQTSTLVKYLFSETGFNAIYEDDLPDDLKLNGCLGLHAKLVEGSSMFTTKAALRLEDCNGQEVFTTKEGKSKKKDYKDSYAEALRDAFQSFKGMNYTFQEKTENMQPITVNMQNDIKHLDKTTAKKTNAISEKKLIEQVATRNEQRYVDRRPIELHPAVEQTSKKPQLVEKKTSNVAQIATREEQRFVDRRPVSSALANQSNREALKETMTQNTDDNMSSSTITNAENIIGLEKVSGTLYAQKLPNGYQLVDSTPKIVMKLSQTSTPDYFIAESSTNMGVVFKKNDIWVFEHYASGQLETQELNIKF